MLARTCRRCHRCLALKEGRRSTAHLVVVKLLARKCVACQRADGLLESMTMGTCRMSARHCRSGTAALTGTRATQPRAARPWSLDHTFIARQLPSSFGSRADTRSSTVTPRCCLALCGFEAVAAALAGRRAAPGHRGGAGPGRRLADVRAAGARCVDRHLCWHHRRRDDATRPLSVSEFATRDAHKMTVVPRLGMLFERTSTCGLPWAGPCHGDPCQQTGSSACPSISQIPSCVLLFDMLLTQHQKAS